jgi:hypothetical protein
MGQIYVFSVSFKISRIKTRGYLSIKLITSCQDIADQYQLGDSIRIFHKRELVCWNIIIVYKPTEAETILKVTRVH